MVLGIVFTAIAVFLCYMGMVMVNIGTSGVDRACEGKEFKLEHLQDMFLRK